MEDFFNDLDLNQRILYLGNTDLGTNGAAIISNLLSTNNIVQ